jgi:prephenate dehydrogenase
VTASPPKSIAFLGLGLIGGSIARALREPRAPGGGDGPRPSLVAWTPDGRGPAIALAGGVIDRVAASAADAVSEADLVVIAAPPLETLGLIAWLGAGLRSALRPGALVTDVASTKGAVMAGAAAAGIPFVGGHPMAGRETRGYQASSAELLEGRPWIVVIPDGMTAAEAEPVRWLARACGARPIELDAATHDVAVAAISHLPLIVSAALVEAVAGPGGEAWPLARTLAASGWEGMTRLARGDPRMGAGIAATNRAALVPAVRAFRDAVDSWLATLDAPGGPDSEVLEGRFSAARDRLAAAGVVRAEEAAGADDVAAAAGPADAADSAG